MEDTVYSRLAKKDIGKGMFPRLPGGDGPYIKWLEYWLSEEEAELMLVLPLQDVEDPIVLSEVANKGKLTKNEAKRILDSLVKKAMVTSVEFKGEKVYLQYNWVYRVECYLTRYVKDLANVDDLHKGLGEWIDRIRNSDWVEKANFYKLIPLQVAIKDTRGVVSTPDATQILEEASFIGVVNCLCRVSSHLVDEPCSYPLEVCFALGEHGREYVQQGYGREVTKEWAIKTVRECEEMGVVHSIDNISDEPPSQLCNCCPCHCLTLSGYKRDKQLIRAAKTDLICSAVLERCNGAGLCVDKCEFGALELQNSKVFIKEERCIGCGFCTTACPSTALVLRKRPPEKMDKSYKTYGEYVEDLKK